jgi:hypothetical protein
MGINVKYVQLDNAKENMKLAHEANGRAWKLNLEFEFTSARTPQRNHLAEIGFSTIWARTRAILDATMVPEEMKYLLYRKEVSHLTLLDQMCVREINSITATRYQHLFCEEWKVVFPLCIWGESGTVKVTGNVKGKLSNRGEQGIFVGYA